MGFTPLEGLVMATRSGTVDPGLLLWLVEHGGLTASEVLDGIDRGGGLLGLAGTKDMREVLRTRRQRGRRRAAGARRLPAPARGVGRGHDGEPRRAGRTRHHRRRRRGLGRGTPAAGRAARLPRARARPGQRAGRGRRRRVAVRCRPRRCWWCTPARTSRSPAAPARSWADSRSSLSPKLRFEAANLLRPAAGLRDLARPHLAASSSATSTMVSPPRNSLVSTYGPSVITKVPLVVSAL